MSFPKTLRICSSVLMAQHGLIQALEVIQGQEIVLCDLAVPLNERVTGQHCPVRIVSLHGHAQCVNQKGEISAPFEFDLQNLQLLNKGGWEISKTATSHLFIDNMYVGGEEYYALTWTYNPMYRRPCCSTRQLVVVNRYPSSERNLSELLSTFMGESRHNRSSHTLPK